MFEHLVCVFTWMVVLCGWFRDGLAEENTALKGRISELQVSPCFHEALCFMHSVEDVSPSALATMSAAMTLGLDGLFTLKLLAHKTSSFCEVILVSGFLITETEK